MPEYREISEIAEAMANDEFVSDEESLFFAIWEIIVRPEPERTAIPV